MPEPMSDPNDMRKYSNALRLVSERRIRALWDRLEGGEIQLAEWQEEMKAELRRANLQQFVTGNGGVREGIRRTDYLKLGPELKRQYAYLRRFAAVVEKTADEGRSIAGFRARATMYARSTQAMFWKAHVPVKLPQVPRDGKTRCKTHCKCRLRIQYERGEDGQIVAVLVWWKLSPAEHCNDCRKLARTWNPLRIEVEGLEESDIEQAVALMLAETPELAGAAREIYAMWNIEEAA